MLSTFALPRGWKGLENNLLIPNWSHTSFNTLLLNSVPLSLNMAIFPHLLTSVPDKYALTTFSRDFSFMGTVNTLDVRRQIAVKAYPLPLEVIGEQLMVSIASTAMVFSEILNAVVDTLPW